MERDSNQELLKEYGIYDMLNDNAVLFEQNYNLEDEDWEEFKFVMGRLKELIPSLMKRLISKGYRKAVSYLCSKARDTYNNKKTGKITAVKTLFFGLLMLCTSLSVSFLKNYNDKPVFPQTRVEIITEEDAEYMIVEDSSGHGEMIVYEKTEDGFPEIVEKTEKANEIAKKIKNSNQEQKKLSTKKYTSPIVLLNNNIRKSAEYRISDEMIEALMEVEDFSPVIYDAKRPKRKNINMNDMS